MKTYLKNWPQSKLQQDNCQVVKNLRSSCESRVHVPFNVLERRISQCITYILLLFSIFCKCFKMKSKTVSHNTKWIVIKFQRPSWVSAHVCQLDEAKNRKVHQIYIRIYIFNMNCNGIIMKNLLCSEIKGSEVWMCEFLEIILPLTSWKLWLWKLWLLFFCFIYNLVIVLLWANKLY